jgi:hypothetical protein
MTIRLTKTSKAAVEDAAKSRGMSVSQLGEQVVLAVVLKDRGQIDVMNEMAVEAVNKFRKMFCRIMYRSLSGTLTKQDIERLEKDSL